MGTLAGEILEKWVNGFWIKAYKGPMVANMFKIPEQYSDSHDVRTGATGDQPDVSTSGETRLRIRNQTTPGLTELVGADGTDDTRNWWMDYTVRPPYEEKRKKEKKKKKITRNQRKLSTINK